MEESNWELSFGLFNGILFGYRQYPDGNKIDHVIYVGVFDICLTLYYEKKFRRKNKKTKFE